MVTRVTCVRGYRGMGGVRGILDAIVVPQGVRDVIVDVC